MDRLQARLSVARRTLDRLSPLASRAVVTDIERDAAIQRFEFCFEATWKAAQLFLSLREGIEAGSPKAVIRAALQSGLLSEEETRSALVMADDRNLTVHTYNEEFAKRIFADLAAHAALLEHWISVMEARRG
jgi:nucleotidyltransferase substrate binding protein (TIGR01987 family)